MRIARPDLAALIGVGSLGLTVARVVRLARFGAARHRLPSVHPLTRTADRVSAVVPARDEVGSIGACVAALSRSGRELAEVVVVDDGSTDATVRTALASGDDRVRTVAASELQPGQLGKAMACATGAAATSGDWLWFVDADVAVEPDLLARLLAAAEEADADLVSALGRLVTRGWQVDWLLPAVGLALARRTDPDRVTDPSSGGAFAAGHCLLVRRSTYDEAGGHRAIADRVVDDVALATVVKDRGGTVVLATAFDGFTAQMYDDVAAMWRGLLKNTSAVRTRPLVVEAALALLCLAPVRLAFSGDARVRTLARIAVATQVGVDVAARAVAHQPTRSAVLAPLTDLVLTAHHLHAAVLRRSGRTVAWRGRDVVPG